MLGLRTKILLGFGGLLTILLIVSAVSSFVFSQYSGATQLMLEQDYNSVSACQDMERAVELSDALLEKTLLGEPTDAAPKLEAQAQTFESALALQRQSLNLPGEAAATDVVASLWADYRGSLPQIIDGSRPITERRQRFDELVRPRSEQLITAARHITDRNRDNVTSTQGEAQTLARNARYALHLLTAAAVLFAVVFSLTIGRVILQPLGSLTRSVQEIRRGNLDAFVPVQSSDELGQLAVAFNEMAEQLRIFRQIDHEKLIRTQRTTQLAIDSLPDPVVVLSPQGRIELTNDAARNWFGLEPGELSPAIAKENAWLGDVIARTISEEKSAATPAEPPSGYESTVQVSRDGEDRHLLPRTVPIRDEHNRIIGATVVLNDVTGLRRLDQMKSGLLSLVSHELKTPLTSMRMILHLLVDAPAAPLDAETRDLLITARDDSDRLHRIVENLLDMGRIQSGRVLMELKPTSADDLMVGGIEPLRSMYEEHRVALQMDDVAGDLRVMADTTRIGHVFANLLANALRYTPAGGAVRISARRDSHRDVIDFVVTDTGSGIPRQHLPRVFEKFFRVPGQTSGGGAGLGLAIVKDIVEAHGGRVTIDSEEGRGTTVVFTLQSVPRDGGLEAGDATSAIGQRAGI